jgi:Phage integrase family
VRLHHLRRSFASLAAGRGVALQMIGKLLGHRVPATTQRYVHLARDAVAAVNDELREARTKAIETRSNYRRGAPCGRTSQHPPAPSVRRMTPCGAPEHCSGPVEAVPRETPRSMKMANKAMMPQPAARSNRQCCDGLRFLTTL